MQTIQEIKDYQIQVAEKPKDVINKPPIRAIVRHQGKQGNKMVHWEVYKALQYALAGLDVEMSDSKAKFFTKEIVKLCQYEPVELVCMVLRKAASGAYEQKSYHKFSLEKFGSWMAEEKIDVAAEREVYVSSAKGKAQERIDEKAREVRNAQSAPIIAKIKAELEEKESQKQAQKFQEKERIRRENKFNSDKAFVESVREQLPHLDEKQARELMAKCGQKNSYGEMFSAEAYELIKEHLGG